MDRPRVYTLTESEGAHLWRCVLRSQGLAFDSRLRSVDSAADRSFGFHSARVASPYATAAARTEPGTDLSGLLGPAGHDHLITLRCMRRTLHCLPLPLAEIAHAATLRYRLQTVRGTAARQGVSWGAVVRVADEVARVIGVDGPITERQLETALQNESVKDLRLSLKYLWESGVLSYRNAAPRWDRQHRTFRLTSHSHPTFRPSLEESQARLDLIRHYFERFGPATVDDAAWWSGLSRATVRQGLATLDVVHLDIPWSTSSHFMFRKTFESWRLEAPIRIGVSLLAHEDVALKAYRDSRTRYLGVNHEGALFNQIGEVRPVILREGVGIGTWSWDPFVQQIRLQMLDDAVSSEASHDVNDAAQMMTESLRAGLNRN